jgi:uncharacterized protein YjiS (DUF1127 family)
MQTFLLPSASATARATASALAESMSRCLNNISRRHTHRSTLKQLGQLDDHLLKDIGLHRSELTSIATSFGMDPTRRLR